MSRPAGWGQLGRVPLRFPFEILRAVAAKAAAARGDAQAYLPRVRLDLAARNTSYEGHVLAMEERGDGTLVMFRNFGDSLTYLHLGVSEPFAISVFDPDDQLELLGGEEATRFSDDEPLGALEARRAIADVSAKLAQAGVALDVSAAIVSGASSANNTARDVSAALGAWWATRASDAVGSAAVKKLKRVLLRPGESTVVKEGETLVVGIGKRGWPSKEALVSAVEAAL